MQRYQRVFMVVTDSLGVGADQHAKEFGDRGAHTFYHISQTGLLAIPTWKQLGIDSITKLTGFNKIKHQKAYTMRLAELSNAKDTLAGHWEMMGIRTETPFPTFTRHGFPPQLITALEKAFGRKVIGNKAASGTDILNELAMQAVTSNAVIVYTSADSVMQICGHEQLMGLDTLYDLCAKARVICDSQPTWRVGRIIARPFTGNDGHWTRTANRRDYAVEPPKPTLLDTLLNHGISTVGVGKIHDIFNGRGISQTFHGASDDANMDITIDLATQKSKHPTFIFVNLVDFDSLYGHRRDAEGYAENINRFDIKLAKLINAMHIDDLLIITSDHGNDPTFPGTDHTREYVPGTIFAKNFQMKPRFLGTLQGFGTLGNIVAINFGVPLIATGENVTDLIG